MGFSEIHSFFRFLHFLRSCSISSFIIIIFFFISPIHIYRLRTKDNEYRFEEDIRRETWIRPEGEMKMHGAPASAKSYVETSEEEKLETLGPSDVRLAIC